MSNKRENSRNRTDRRKAPTTSFDPRGPIEITGGQGADDNSGTTSPPNALLGEDRKDPTSQRE